jgi:hypothetical protein
MKTRVAPIALLFILFSASAFSQAQTSSSDKTSDAGQKSQAKNDSPAKAKSPDAAKPRSVMDRPLGEKPEPLVVPAGTEVRVDLVDGKVVVPVRVGFATAIPALSKAVVKIDRVYGPTAYDANGNLLGNTRYAEYGVLTAVTINGATYQVETNSVPLATPGSSAVSADNSMGDSVHEVKFVLSAPLSIAR